MARLNEAPVPAESIDALKRRFIRQNRELAKNNSTQSIRIRTLESETARLVAENLTLRERVIQLEAQLEKSHGYQTTASIGAVKDKLEAKMQELGGLIAELGLMQKPHKKTKRSSTSPKVSSDQRYWRNPVSLAETLAAQEGRLPTISEGKYYPRRTLEAEEIRNSMVDPSSESPDLGPPPVAHFQDEDPIKFDPQPLATPTQDVNSELCATDALPAALSANLETRKKRRDSHGRSDVRRMSVFHSPPEKAEGSIADQSLPIRTSTKRKLAVREDETRAGASTLQEEDFAFSRKTDSEAQDGKDKALLPEAEDGAVELAAEQRGTQLPRQEPTHVPVVLERKALGNKSVNTSPRKVANPVVGDVNAELKKPAASIRDTTRSRNRDRKPKQPTNSTVVEISPPIAMDDCIEVKQIPADNQLLPPKTPADLDLFSPTSTAASTTKPESNDTPPPTDLNPSSALTSAAETNAGRVARRARANVNYAEPNLVSKMRRPTKELADAVVRDDKRGTKENPVVIPLSSAAETEQKKMRTVVIKRERDEAKEDAWKSLPVSGLGKIEEPGSPLSKKSADTKRDGISGKDSDVTATALTSEDSSTADNPSAAVRRKHSRISSAPVSAVPPDDSRNNEGSDKRDSLAVFDFAESSPTDVSKNTGDSRSNRNDPAKARVPRRHSSISSLAPAKETTATRPNANTVAPAWNKAGEEGGRSKALREMKQRASTELSDAAGNKNERMMARRRSMMI